MKSLSIFFMAVLVASCAKVSLDGSGSATKITVKEWKTNAPLPYVTIRLSRCTNYDFVFGCLSTGVFATYQTDQKGECRIKNTDMNRADNGIELSKTQYWSRDGGTGENFLEPEAWAMIHLKAVNTYPDTAIIGLGTFSEAGFVSWAEFPAPTDSTVRYRLFGNESNVIHWNVFTRLRNCILYCPIDSLSSGMLTLDPQKFATLSATIEY